jgi:hypothetical protein
MLQAQSKKSYDQMSGSEKLKLQNLKGIFDMCCPQLYGQVPSRASQVVEEEKDVDMIDSSSHRNHRGGAPQRFIPPYQE